MAASVVARGMLAPSLCTGMDRHLAGVWDDATRARLRAQAAPDTRLGLVYVEAVLDTYAESLTHARTEPCAATRITGEQSEARMDRHMACLDTRHQHLEALVGLHEELVRAHTVRAATPEEARRANTELRAAMRARGNYFAEIETVAGQVSSAVGRRGGPLTDRGVTAVTEHLGFSVHRVADLPRSTRSIIDSRHRRIFLPAGGRGGADPRTIVLQTLGHVALGHAEPTSYADFLRQRVEVNYFAAALLVPERAAVDFLQEAKAERALAIDDLRDAFAVSYETAAHRFTNLATRHLDIPVHFMRVGEDGVIYKAYENDDVTFPTDVTGAIEGQTVCRYWASRAVFRNTDRYATHHQYTDMGRGTYWCTTHVERTGSGDFAIDVGVPFEHARWFQGRETTVRARSTCPDPGCCRRPPAGLAERWSGEAWPSARAHSHLLAAIPPGTFPGVDDTEVYEFLERHTATAPAARALSSGP